MPHPHRIVFLSQHRHRQGERSEHERRDARGAQGSKFAIEDQNELSQIDARNCERMFHAVSADHR